MKRILSLLLATAFLASCKKEAVTPAKPKTAADDIHVMVYATADGDTTPVATTTILRLSLR